MKPVIWIAIAVAVAVAIGLQFVPVERSNPPETSAILAPPEIRSLLERSCYDCHSNRTDWPWYAYVAPASWFVTDHVEEGRSHVNFTEWPLLDAQTQQYHLAEMKEEIKSRRMPLRSYLWLHWDARLSDEERARLIGWIDEEIAALTEF